MWKKIYNYILAIYMGITVNYVMYRIVLNFMYDGEYWYAPFDLGCIVSFLGINIVVAALIDLLVNKVKKRNINPIGYLSAFVIPSLVISFIIKIYLMNVTKNDSSADLIIALRKMYIYVAQSAFLCLLVMIFSVAFGYIQYKKYKYIYGGVIANVIVMYVMMGISTVIFNAGKLEGNHINLVCIILMIAYACIMLKLFKKVIASDERILDNEAKLGIEDGCKYRNKLWDYIKMYFNASTIINFYFAWNCVTFCRVLSPSNSGDCIDIGTAFIMYGVCLEVCVMVPVCIVISIVYKVREKYNKVKVCNEQL